MEFKMKILKNKTTGEERPLIRCGITYCNQVIHIGDSMGYDKNYDVFCESCSDDLFVSRGQIDDDWISGDNGWEEVDESVETLTEREELEKQHGQVWNTKELQKDFTVQGFASPCVLVIRKSDGTKGTLEFIHQPRFYFDFVAG
jgi:hypothetical protein